MGFWANLRSRTTLKTTSTANPTAWLQDADKLVMRAGEGAVRDVITIQGRGPYYHVAMFYWQGKEPWVVEMVETVGGQTLPFDQWRAGRSPSEIVDVYRPDAYGCRDYDHAHAVKWMLANVPGRPYGWATIKRFARQASWLTCWWNRPCTDEDAPLPDNYVCSTAVAAADKVGGGVHPVSALWVGDVTPTVLARGKLHDYLVTFPTHP